MIALKAIALFIVVGYAAALAALYALQERVIFPATPLPADHRFVFGGQPFEELAIQVPGATLDALHFTQPKPRGLVFFIHGNGGNLATWTTGIEFYRRVEYDLFIFDYRGYGKSTGRIESEAQLHADVRAAFDAIAPRYREKPIVVYGRSLGSGLAIELAREVSPDLLVLVTPYTSLAALGQRAYPWAPTWLLKYPLHVEEAIQQVRSPILMFQGTEDRIIPPGQSEELKALARAPVDLVVVQGAGHNDLHRFPAYIDHYAEALRRVADRPGNAPRRSEK